MVHLQDDVPGATGRGQAIRSPCVSCLTPHGLTTLPLAAPPNHRGKISPTPLSQVSPQTFWASLILRLPLSLGVDGHCLLLTLYLFRMVKRNDLNNCDSFKE